MSAERHEDIIFGKVGTEAQTQLAQALGIASIPTLMVLRDGILLYAQPGALPERALDQLRHDHGLLVVGTICWAKVTSAAL